MTGPRPFRVRRRPDAAADAPRTPRARRLAPVAAAAAVLLAGCLPAHDYGGTLGADRTWVDSAGDWWIEGSATPIWDGPPLASSDRYVPGDYDGDGRWEPAVFDVSDGLWITAGGRGTFAFTVPSVTAPAFEAAIPVPADYDGDGDTDAAFYDAATAVWLVEGGSPIVFGRPTTDPTVPVIGGYRLPDVPAPADYDGDGDDDVAVHRLETGDLHIAGGPTIATGLMWALPAPGNWGPGPGDEAAAMAWYPNQWWIEGEGIRTPFAAETTGAPVPADYDGDGTVDAAILGNRPSITWRIEDQPDASVPTRSSPVASPPVQAYELPVLFASQFCAGYAVADWPCPGAAHTAITPDGAWKNLGGPHTLPTTTPVVFTSPPGSLPVTADYDGDGTRELAGYDPATGQWHTDGTLGTFTYAAPPDIDTDPTTGVHPVPADYDGDGDDDPAFYRDADATWFVQGRPSTQHGRTTAQTPTFGTTPLHDLPVPGDYDGDGDTDPAVYRLDTAQLHIAGQAPITTGWPAGDPAVGDYDGDGSDELGLRDEAATPDRWFILGGTTISASVLNFSPTGASYPVVADHDGDGDDEPGVAGLSPGALLWYTVGLQQTAGAAGAVAGVGRYETIANHPHVAAFIAACVAVTPPPGDCT